MIFALIPARAGSKRIPLKNIREFDGKPIIAYSIEAAFQSKLFDKVIVSTDSPDIAAIAKKYGAETPFVRPRDISDDHASTVDVIKHAVGYMRENFENVTHCCCIYATAPFLQAEYLVRAMNELKANAAKLYAFSVAEFSFPVQRALSYKDDKLSPMYPEYVSTRSQDLPPAYHDAGQFYFGKCDAFLNDIPVFGEHAIPVILPSYLVQDIDTENDWHRAEVMHKANKLSHPA